MNDEWDLIIFDEMFCPHAYAIALRLKKERNIPFIPYSTGGQLTISLAAQLSLSKRCIVSDEPHHGILQLALRSFALTCFRERHRELKHFTHRRARFSSACSTLFSGLRERAVSKAQMAATYLFKRSLSSRNFTTQGRCLSARRFIDAVSWLPAPPHFHNRRLFF